MSSIEVNSSTDFDIDGYNLIWATWAALNLQLQAHGVMKSPYAERNWRNFSSVQLRYYVWPVWNFTKRFYTILKIRAGLSAVAASCQCQILSGEPTIPGKLLGSRVLTLQEVAMPDQQNRGDIWELHRSAVEHSDAPCHPLQVLCQPHCCTPVAPDMALAIQDMLLAAFVQAYLVPPFLLWKSSFIKAVSVQLAQRHYSKAYDWTLPCRQIARYFYFLWYLFHPVTPAFTQTFSLMWAKMLSFMNFQNDDMIRQWVIQLLVL